MKDNRFTELKFKKTINRAKIINFFDNYEGLVSAEEIYFKLKENSSISLSTVYRILSTLSDTGVIQKSSSIDGKHYYQSIKNGHAHHLICKSCGKTIHLSDCPIDKIQKKIEKDTGFSISNHNLEFIGICPDCKK